MFVYVIVCLQISVALFALAVSAAPPALQTPVAFTPLQHHPGAYYPQAVPATRATYVPQHYQVTSSTVTSLFTILQI